MAVTYYVALPFIRTEDGTEVKHRSAKAKLPRSGGPKECRAILPMRVRSAARATLGRATGAMSASARTITALVRGNAPSAIV